MPRVIGERVGAMQRADPSTVYLFGYGVYDGDHQPPDEFGVPFPNPRITLDNGKVVWGCECWWGSEERIKQEIGARTVVEVDPEEHRR
jgi:hypothetical protein